MAPLEKIDPEPMVARAFPPTVAAMTHAARSAEFAAPSAVTSTPNSPCRLMRRKRSVARSRPSPIHRRRMSPSRQRLMFRVTCRSVPIRFSMQFVRWCPD